MTLHADRETVRRALVTFALCVLAAVIVGATCAMLAPGSREVLTDVGDMPLNAQDEMRVGAEVWFSIATSALAVLTTVLWWRRRFWRGPAGMLVAVIGAAAQTGIGALAWKAVVAVRPFATAPGVGAEHLKAPVLTGTTSMWLAAVCATLAYVFVTIIAPRSDLR